MMTLTNKLTRRLMTLVAMMATITSQAAVEKKVFTYSTSPRLELSRYADTADTASLRPCIIFAFGGGFTHGNRDDARYQAFFDFMARRGYVVCSIDYRTTLGQFSPTGSDALQAYGAALAQAIGNATADFLTATTFVRDHAADWRIDPSKLIASGSSAGAITALQAEYMLINNTGGCTPGFAAAVTFAGAIFVQGQPQGLDRFCPAMMFHGDADRQVPYSELVLGPVGLYGSRHLADAFKTAGLPGAFWTEMGAGHEMALEPMTSNLYDIAGFLDRVLNSDSKAYNWTTSTIPGRTDYQTKFTIMDYIRGNM